MSETGLQQGDRMLSRVSESITLVADRLTQLAYAFQTTGNPIVSRKLFEMADALNDDRRAIREASGKIVADAIRVRAYSRLNWLVLSYPTS